MGQVLSSWQKIATYVGKGLRTVQRWEREIEFPVHRTGRDGRQIIGYTDEIDNWMHRSQPAIPATAVVQDALAKRRAEMARLRDQVERAREQTMMMHSILSDCRARRLRRKSECNPTPPQGLSDISVLG